MFDRLRGRLLHSLLWFIAEPEVATKRTLSDGDTCPTHGVKLLNGGPYGPDQTADYCPVKGCTYQIFYET